MKTWIVYLTVTVTVTGYLFCLCKSGSKLVLFKIWLKYTSIRGLTHVAKHCGIIHETLVISETASVGLQRRLASCVPETQMHESYERGTGSALTHGTSQ